ncbi:MAG: DUF455 family protein [Parachlamydiaceae bacterium]|nr:DUF455 family protein [Parachlamydiaceae bacterium]
MELHDWAKSILTADTLEGKLAYPDLLTDNEPGPAIIWEQPERPPGMEFKRPSKKDKLPSFHEFSDPDKRAICLHRFAGHELLAVEIMAYTLLAFPDAPARFRKGLAHTLNEEQGHVKLYMEQMERLGIKFGDLPLYRHFWKHTPHIQSPLHYVTMMSLTFEMANLDFAPMYGNAFLKHGDHEAAQLMATILNDEISHVSFGLNWLKRLKKENDTEWECWEQTLSSTLLTPHRARGFIVNEEPRQKAGIPQEWISNLYHAKPKT